jgi:hypothetical protein
VRKPAKRKPARDARLEAVQLLGKWTRLAQGHVLIGGGNCSCGLGAGSLRIADFEQQILDYLRAKHPAAAKAPSVNALLGLLAARPANGDIGATLSLLSDLNRTLESFDEVHGGRQT